MSLHEIHFNGALLTRGFWLYVWEISPPTGEKVYYVGRTGDSSSRFAQSPFNRMGQHFGRAVNSNMVRTHVEKRGFSLEACTFRLLAHGPILPEGVDMDEHRERRDVVAALEKALADTMRDAGYAVMNTVKCRKTLDAKLFAQVRVKFATYYPKLQPSAFKVEAAV